MTSFCLSMWRRNGMFLFSLIAARERETWLGIEIATELIRSHNEITNSGVGHTGNRFPCVSRSMDSHAYQGQWIPTVGERLPAERQSGNLVDRYAVAVKKRDDIVGHLQKGPSGKFAKIVFYLTAGQSTAGQSSCWTVKRI